MLKTYLSHPTLLCYHNLCHLSHCFFYHSWSLCPSVIWLWYLRVSSAWLEVILQDAILRILGISHMWRPFASKFGIHHQSFPYLLCFRQRLTHYACVWHFLSWSTWWLTLMKHDVSVMNNHLRYHHDWLPLIMVHLQMEALWLFSSSKFSFWSPDLFLVSVL